MLSHPWQNIILNLIIPMIVSTISFCLLLFNLFRLIRGVLEIICCRTLVFDAADDDDFVAVGIYFFNTIFK